MPRLSYLQQARSLFSNEKRRLTGLDKVESSLELSHILKQQRLHQTAMKSLLTPQQVKLCNYQLSHVLCHTTNTNYESDSDINSAVGEGAANFLNEI